LTGIESDRDRDSESDTVTVRLGLPTESLPGGGPSHVTGMAGPRVSRSRSAAPGPGPARGPSESLRLAGDSNS
jgi:hypothetical protein